MGNRPCKALVSYEEACKRLPLDAFRRIQDMFASFTGRRDMGGRLSRELFAAHVGTRLRGANEALRARLYDAVATGGKTAGIDFQEFLVGMYIMDHGGEDLRLRMVFNMYDLDADGFVGKNELRKMTTALFMGEAPESWEVAVDDEDGQVFFETVQAKAFKPLVDAHVEAALRENDADRDGKLSWTEFQRYAETCDPIICVVEQMTAPDLAVEACVL